MFQFFMGLVLGFFLAWMFRSESTGTEMMDRAEDMGRTAQRRAQEMTGETRRTFEGMRDRTTS